MKEGSQVAEFTYLKGFETLSIGLPNARTEIVAGVPWGDPCALFTPAYWYTQYIMRYREHTPERHRIGDTFAEELTLCLLGGYGIPAEIGMAAFERLKRQGLISTLCDDAAILEVELSEPLQIGDRQVRYRFWKQKARFLAGALSYLRSARLAFDNAVELRNTLMRLPGIGPKTASWIARNWTGSDEVAILDIHIVRAGMFMNLYHQDERVERHYLQMEQKFVALAKGMNVPTSDLDALIWSMMRTTPRLVARLLDSLHSAERVRLRWPNRANPVASGLKGVSGTSLSAV